MLGRVRDFIVVLWWEHKNAIIALLCFSLALILGLSAIFIQHKKKQGAEGDDSSVNLAAAGDYGDIFAIPQEGASVSTNAEGVRVRLDEESGEEIEDPTLLKEREKVGSGYLNHCAFLGDSRTVGMVSYGVISDEDALAQVGISHMAYAGYTFTQNSGKKYTMSSYLAERNGDVLYIGLGVNGMNGVDEESYERSYKSLVEKIMEQAPDSRIVLMAIWPVDDNGMYKKSVKNEWINKYNAFLQTLAEYEGIYYLAVDEVLKDENGQLKKAYDGGDGLHCSKSAYGVILDYILTHAVPGVPDEGEYKVHFVAPKGQYKDMVMEPGKVPTPVPVITAVEETPAPEAEDVEPETPTPTLTPTPTATPTLKPTPTPEVKGGDNDDNEDENKENDPGDNGENKTGGEDENDPGDEDENKTGEDEGDTPTPTPTPTGEDTPEVTDTPTPTPSPSPGAEDTDHEESGIGQSSEGEDS